MKKLLLILLCFPLLVFSQEEKRLALVIGNANYDKGELDNPVNDALLVAKTLEDLDFDVILDTNLSNRSALNNSIKEFGQRRDDYDVGFVYYAGHGIQINSTNYLLPTKVAFESVYDVQDNAVSVQNIMRYLTSATDQVNVLILDACRDNPFEGNWNKTRSLKGSGLAKMKAPTGSLIAFSTTAGSTAPDGDGVNSVYCTSLVKNMMFDGISLDQVFRNVRAEVFKLTNGGQQTEEATQLTGETFYLVKSNFEKQFQLIDSLILDENLDYSTNERDRISALEIVTSILNTDSKNRFALIKKGEIYTLIQDYVNALNIYNKAIELYPNDPVCYMYRGFLYSNYLQDSDNALNDFNQSLKIDSLYRSSYNHRADVYYSLEDYQSALPDYTKAINLQKDNPLRYIERAECYVKLEDFNNAQSDYTSAIDLDPKNPLYLNDRASFYRLNKEDDLALADYAMAIEISKDDYQTSRAHNNRGIIYGEQENYTLQIEEYNKAIETYSTALNYTNRAYVYQDLEDYKKAIEDFSNAIEIDKENPGRYMRRAKCYNLNKQHVLALNDYNMAIRLKDDYHWYYYTRAYTKSVYLSKHEEAIKDYTKSIELDSTYIFSFRDRADAYRALGNTVLALTDIKKAINIKPSSHMYNVLGNVYLFDLNDYDNALLSYQSAIRIDSTFTYPYQNRIKINEELEEYEKVLADLNTLITIEPNNDEYYLERADYFNYQEVYDSALADYSKVLELTTDDNTKARAINNRALIYGYQEKFELEIEEYTRALEIKQDALWYSNRGAAYEKLEQFDKALLDYNQMVLFDPDNLEVWNTRGLFYNNRENYQNAINDFNQSLKIDGESAYTHWYLASASSDSQDYQKSLIHYAKAIKIIKSSDLLNDYEIQQYLPQIISQRAYVYMFIGELKKAINDCNESIDLDSSNMFSYMSLSGVYMRLGDYKSIFATCDKGLKNSVGGESILNLLKGVSYARIDEFDSAYAIFHHALEVNEYPHMPVIIYDMLTKLSIHTQNYDKAIDYCMKAIEHDEKDLDAYNNLSIIYADQNNPFKAIVNLTKIIEQVLINNLKAPNKDDALLKDYDENESTLSLTDIYIKRGELWKTIKDDEEMCKDYQKACDLGDCEMFNANCK
jgi:tetratricopeptide (TPR) repeat protein